NISAPGATSCAAALDGYLFAGGPWGIRMSADNGASWHQALQDLPAGYRAIRIFTVGSRVFVAGEGYGGLYASADYGLSWEYAGTGMSGGDAYTNNMTGSGDLLFARVDQGALLYVSDNGGQQWYAAQLPSGPAFYYNGVMHVSGDSLYVYDQFNGNQSLARRPVTSLSLQKLFGAVFFDSNHDGLRDSTELGIAGLPVYLHNGPGITLTDSLGRYTLALDAAVDTLKVHVPFLLAEVLPVAYTVTQAMQGLDFAIFSDVQDVSAELYSFIPPRPGFTQHLFLSVRNNSGELLNNIPLRWRPDPQWEILSTHPAATLVGDTLQWLLDSLPVLGIWSADLLIRLPATTPLGYPSTDIAWTTLAGDDFPANDRDTLRQTTVGSFDPNDKQVDHELLSTAQAAARAKLQYQIRFQNTGTFPAEFVRIRDTLPAGLDPSTFRLLASSHPVQVQLQAPGQLDFFFDHIDLPAKPANEVGSHGFVTFEITVGPGLVAGDSINNRAGIYFDYNQPVITQNAVTRILDSLIVGLGGPPHTASALKIYPNPARNQATIEWPENVTHGDLQLLLLDAQGHLLRQLNPPSGRTFEINVSAWPAGNYWLVAKNKTQVRVGKLVVK
ncbi:MAG: T9SS type A sorting domain-containing protein, partial [Saprospiraceae bacterium]